MQEIFKHLSSVVQCFCHRFFCYSPFTFPNLDILNGGVSQREPGTTNCPNSGENIIDEQIAGFGPDLIRQAPGHIIISSTTISSWRRRMRSGAGLWCSKARMRIRPSGRPVMESKPFIRCVFISRFQMV